MIKEVLFDIKQELTPLKEIDLSTLHPGLIFKALKELGYETRGKENAGFDSNGWQSDFWAYIFKDNVYTGYCYSGSLYYIEGKIQKDSYDL